MASDGCFAMVFAHFGDPRLEHFLHGWHQGLFRKVLTRINLLNGLIPLLEILLLILDEADELASAAEHSIEESCSFIMALRNRLLQLHPSAF